MKQIIEKLDFIVAKKNFCSAKDITRRIRQATDWEKIFTRHIYDKELAQKYTNNFNNKKTSNLT